MELRLFSESILYTPLAFKEELSIIWDTLFQSEEDLTLLVTTNTILSMAQQL